MGRGETQEGFEFERSSLELHSRALKNALTLAIEKAIPLTLRASKPQLAAWILSSLIPSDGLLIEAKEFLTDIASGELLTSGDIDLIHDLGERIDEWKYQAGEPENLEAASNILFHSASHLALKAATLPTSSPMAKKASAQAIRSALYALAFSNPEKMEETLDRLDAGLLLAELGESGKTLYSEEDVPYQALSWLHWERDVEMAIEDGLITEIDLFLSQVARLGDRDPSLALSLTSLCALDAQGLVIKEDWSNLLYPLLVDASKRSDNFRIPQNLLEVCLASLEDAEETAEAFEESDLPERRSGESDEEFLARRRTSEVLRMQTGQATRAIVGASRVALFWALGEEKNLIGLMEHSIRLAAEALAYADSQEAYQRLLLRIAQT